MKEDLYNETLAAANALKGIAAHTALQRNTNLSETYGANIYLKREDLQVVRSYKIRGAYYKINSLTDAEKKRGVICASAGNHAQGVAYACNKLGIKGKIYMPSTAPAQKVKQVKLFGKANVEVIVGGDTFDDAYAAGIIDSRQSGMCFIHPFDDAKVIAGQGTVGLEILQDASSPIDYLFIPIGGGGLAAGCSNVFEKQSPATKMIGVEPLGAPAMKVSIDTGENITIEKINNFVDGAAVKRVGDLPFEICRHTMSDILLIPEGKVCTTILKLYNEEAIVVEPSGALSITALDFYKDKIKGKTVVCIVSGSNNDITRMEEIKERSLLYEGLKHYFIISFAQRPGSLRQFIDNVLSPDMDITYFQYSKKINREQGPAVVGIELRHKEDYDGLIQRMDDLKLNYRYLNEESDLYTYLVGV
jgi:threonine dehydratase